MALFFFKRSNGKKNWFGHRWVRSQIVSPLMLQRSHVQRKISHRYVGRKWGSVYKTGPFVLSVCLYVQMCALMCVCGWGIRWYVIIRLILGWSLNFMLTTLSLFTNCDFNDFKSIKRSGSLEVSLDTHTRLDKRRSASAVLVVVLVKDRAVWFFKRLVHISLSWNDFYIII